MQNFFFFFSFLFFSFFFFFFFDIKPFNLQAAMRRFFPHRYGWHFSASSCFWVCWRLSGALWIQSGCFQLAHAQGPWKEKLYIYQLHFWHEVFETLRGRCGGRISVPLSYFLSFQIHHHCSLQGSIYDLINWFTILQSFQIIPVTCASILLSLNEWRELKLDVMRSILGFIL